MSPAGPLPGCSLPQPPDEGIPVSAPADLIVIGAGPAGAQAAITACGLGLSVVLVDEAPAAGGQVHRAPSLPVAATDPLYDAQGDALRLRLSRSAAQCLAGHVVWNVARSAVGASSVFEVSALGPAGPVLLRAHALVVASGATERVYARPGWTLPGVIGLGATTVMVKSFGLVPGRRVLVVGTGPLLSLVAHLVLRAGASVAAVADIHPLWDWLRLLPAMASRPDLLLRGVAWQLELLARGVPVHRGFDIERIHGTDSVTGARLVHAGDGRVVEVEADTVCMGHGLVPSTDICRLLGAEHHHAAALGGWVPRLDAFQRTSVPRLYAAGDGARLLGAAAAPLQGELAALAAAQDLGVASAKGAGRHMAKVRAGLDRAARFGSAMAGISAARPEAMREVSDLTIVCRCEDIRAGDIRAAVEAGARTLNALKSATRCGMGPCGGRSCAASAGALLECAGISPREIGQTTARPPLRPLPLAALTGEFDYADIPLPEPAPV